MAGGMNAIYGELGRIIRPQTLLDVVSALWRNRNKRLSRIALWLLLGVPAAFAVALAAARFAPPHDPIYVFLDADHPERMGTLVSSPSPLLEGICMGGLLLCVLLLVVAAVLLIVSVCRRSSYAASDI